MYNYTAFQPIKTASEPFSTAIPNDTSGYPFHSPTAIVLAADVTSDMADPLQSSFVDRVQQLMPCKSSITECKAHNFVFLIAAPILILLALVGNSISFATMMQPRLRKTATGIFIAALAISDTTAVITGLIRHFVLKLTQIDVRMLNPASCQTHRFFLYVSLDTSSWILIAVTIERFVAVCFPTHHKRVKSNMEAIKAIVIILLIETVLNMHVFWTRGKNYPVGSQANSTNQTNATMISSNNGLVELNELDYLYCGYTSPGAERYWLYTHGWIAMLNYCIIPFVVMLTLNIMIIKKLKHVRLSLKSRNSSTMSSVGITKQTNSMTRMLLCVTFYFIAVTAPVFIFTMLEGIVFYSRMMSDIDHARLELVDAILTIFLYLNHSVNFFLYCLTGRRFRKELQIMFGCLPFADQPQKNAIVNGVCDEGKGEPTPTKKLMRVQEVMKNSTASTTHMLIHDSSTPGTPTSA